MKEIFFLIEDAIEGGYNARCLGENIFTQGDSIKELKENIKDAILCHFDTPDLPKIVRLHFVKDEILTL